MTRALFGLLALVAATPVCGAKAADAPRYPLAVPPLEIIDRMKELPFVAAPKLPADERAFLDRIWKLQAGQAKSPAVADATLLDAMLFASGATGEETLKKYRDQFAKLVASAKAAVADATTDRERGDKLLVFLHKGVMAKGYETHQSSVTAVFDTGTFNCVSSTAVYYLVGKKLGLTLTPISIPGGSFLAGHATVDLVDGGKRVQVEATNADGFDWEAKLSKPGTFTIGVTPDRKAGHDVDGLGVAAMIYSNRGTGTKDDADPLAGVRHCAAGLVLDPADASTLNNLMAGFVNGGPKLAAKGKHEEAVQLIAFGLSISPAARDLVHNRDVVWAEYVKALLAAGKDREAVAVIRRGAKVMPDDRDFQNPARWFGRAGDKVIDATGWEDGLKLAARGEKVLTDKEELAALHGWRGETFRRWSSRLLDAGDAAGSMKVLARAWAVDPTDKEVADAVGYHTQEALIIIRKKDGVPAALAHYKALQEAFPTVAAVADLGHSHAGRAVKELTGAGQFPEALARVKELAPLWGKPDRQAKATANVYDAWAWTFVEKKEWVKALDKYKEGSAACPGQDWLAGNAVAVVDRWADPAIDAKNWDAAIRIYKVGETYHPKNGHLEHNRDYCEKKKAGGK